MSELVIMRAAAAPLEPVGDGWTVGGCAVPYDVESRVSDDGGVSFYLEAIAPGSFKRDVDKGGRWVNLYIGHAGDDGERWLGRCVQLEDRADGLWPWFRLNRDHPRAEEARSGELTGWSVAARVYHTRQDRRGHRSVLVRTSLGLTHVAATARPQYAGAGVAIAREHVLELADPTPNLDRWRSRGYGGRVTTPSRHPA